MHGNNEYKFKIVIKEILQISAEFTFLLRIVLYIQQIPLFYSPAVLFRKLNF